MDHYARADRAVDLIASESQTKQTLRPEDREQSDYGGPQDGSINQENGQVRKFSQNRQRNSTKLHDER